MGSGVVGDCVVNSFHFNPGDMVVIRGLEWPVGSGVIKKWMGLYRRPGYPQTYKHGTSSKVLNDQLCGHAENGQQALVVAVSWNEGDQRWYHMIQCTESGCIGWTRSTARLIRVKLENPQDMT